MKNNDARRLHKSLQRFIIEGIILAIFGLIAGYLLGGIR